MKLNTFRYIVLILWIIAGLINIVSGIVFADISIVSYAFTWGMLLFYIIKDIKTLGE